MIEIQLPVGRIVWGNPAKSQQKRDQKTRLPILKDGKPVEQWAFGVAIPKQAFIQAVWPAMSQEAATLFSGGVPPQFSWKYKDGDGPDRSGKSYQLREGYAGHFVLQINTEAFPPPIYKMGANGQYVQLQSHEIKCGDYIVMTVRFQANKPTDITHTPGLYVNPVGILHVGYGTEIINAPDPTQLFGQQPQFQLPPGASATPLAPSHGVAMPGTAPQYQQPAMPGQPPAQQPYAPPAGPGGYAPPAGPGGYAPPAGPGGYAPPVQPAHDFVQNAGQQYQQPTTGPQPQYQPPGQPQYQPPGQPQYQPQMPGMMPPGNR